MRMRRNLLLLAIIIGGGVCQLVRYECSENCLECKQRIDDENKGHLCLSCLGVEHKRTSALEQTCGTSGIANCVQQVAVWSIKTGETKPKLVQHCAKCAHGYFPKYDSRQSVESTDSNLVSGWYPSSGNINVGCEKPTISGATKVYFRIESDGTTVTENVEKCEFGKTPNTGVSPHTCDAFASDAGQLQKTVANCLIYGTDYCEQCEPKYQLIRTHKQRKNEKAQEYFEYCLPIPQKYYGCSGISYNNEKNGCDDCNPHAGYYAKAVLSDGTQICADKDGNEMDLGSM